jgi:hypothetical protein
MNLAQVPIRLVDRVCVCLATERRLIGLALLRMGVASVVLLYLIGQWPNRHLIWGPNGAYPAWLYARELPFTRAPSLLAADSPLLFELVYHLAIAVAACYLVGWKTVPVSIAFAGLTWSVLRRHPYLMTGGDALLLLILPWLLLTNTSAYLSVDSGWRWITASWRPVPRPWRALLHNIGVLAILLQICTMYLFAGLYKLVGQPWLDGSAAGDVLRVDRFSLPVVSAFVYQNELLSRILTYWTVIFEVTAPVLLWFPATRWLVAVQSVLFHSGIGLLMGLVIFALEATVLQFVVFSDESYRLLPRRIGKWSRRCRAAVYNSGHVAESVQASGLSHQRSPGIPEER